MSSVCGFRNCAACMLNAMEMPRKIVIRFASTFCAVSDSEFNTPHSRIRLPNIRKPTSATAFGAKMPVMIVMTMGKRMRVVLEICFGSYGMRMSRSFFVVSRRMTGRLDDGYQRHIGIGSDGDRADVAALQGGLPRQWMLGRPPRR